MSSRPASWPAAMDKVRLVERHELPPSWDPASDSRLTVWEATQHLIRALESSESDAAALLARIGVGFGDRARQLAYLLYGVCERKKWAEEGGAYNMLVSGVAGAQPSRSSWSRMQATKSGCSDARV